MRCQTLIEAKEQPHAYRTFSEKMQPFKVQIMLVRKTVLRVEAGQHLWNVSMWNVVFTENE